MDTDKHGLIGHEKHQNSGAGEARKAPIGAREIPSGMTKLLLRFLWLKSFWGCGSAAVRRSAVES
jgi:hypothetical protein